jgi:HK97 gp10 family phage protein
MAGTGATVRIISNRLPQVPAMLRTAVNAEVAKAAFEIQAQAQAKAPVKTGTLRRSIHTVLEDGGRRAVVGPSVNYGLYVEMGTRGRAARPFMRPAAEAVLPKFAAAVKSILASLR